jgi:DNA-binding response OmpR family regulator
MVAAGQGNGAKGHGCILVFDNEPIVLDLLAVVLSREGYLVTATLRSEEAVGLASSRRFDLAVADLGLRRGDGRHLVRRLRQLSPETPIVATTAYPAAEIVSFAQEHADVLLPKPFGMGELVVAVSDLLQRGFRGGRGAESPLSSLEGLSPAMSGA